MKDKILVITEKDGVKQLVIPKYTDPELLMWALSYLFLAIEEKENSKINAETILLNLTDFFGDEKWKKH